MIHKLLRVSRIIFIWTAPADMYTIKERRTGVWTIRMKIIVDIYSGVEQSFSEGISFSVMGRIIKSYFQETNSLTANVSLLIWPTLTTPSSLKSLRVSVSNSRPRTSWAAKDSAYSPSCNDSNQLVTSATPHVDTSLLVNLLLDKTPLPRLKRCQKAPLLLRPDIFLRSCKTRKNFSSCRQHYMIVCLYIL